MVLNVFDALIVDLFQDNKTLVSHLRGNKNTFVIYDRTNNQIVPDCISDFDIYSLGLAKRNAFGGSGLIVTNEELESLHPHLIFKAKFLFGFLIGLVVMSSICYPLLRRVKKISKHLLQRRLSTVQELYKSYTPNKILTKSNLDLGQYCFPAKYIDNKTFYKSRIELELKRSNIAAEISGIGRLILVADRSSDDVLKRTIAQAGFILEKPDYVHAISSNRDLFFENQVVDKVIYLIG